jgi:hypothetical protein
MTLKRRLEEEGEGPIAATELGDDGKSLTVAGLVPELLPRKCGEGVGVLRSVAAYVGGQQLLLLWL